MEKEAGMDKAGIDIKYGRQEIPAVSLPVKMVEKYWGSMATIFEDDVHSIKRIFMRAGSQSSMEFHLKKKEMYYIESGELKVGLRIGRAKNKSVILKQGDIFHIEPGLMHMRMAVSDCVIVEVSTKDDDGDSHIVEDGLRYTHQEDE
jgi:mannose-6-phosphate isomerase-like protein (cupin superfamily)